MHQTRESVGHQKGGRCNSHLKGGERKRQTRTPSLRRRKRRRPNIFGTGCDLILRLIRQRLWPVWFSCKKEKKGNTNGCDRTGLFSSQTAVQHQTQCFCDARLQRLTEADTLEWLCHGDMGCQNPTSLSKPALNPFLNDYVLPLALWHNCCLGICCRKRREFSFSIERVISI